MTNLAHIAELVLNRPLLITPAKAQVIMSVLAGRVGVNAPEASRFEGDDTVYDEQGRPVRGDWGERKRKPYKVSNGVGIITITGSLVKRGAWVGAYSGLTSYEGIEHQLKSALADPAVKSILLDLHTPGGEAVGAFETAALVRQAATQKRTVAVVNGMAASAGYAIASGANDIIATETGVAGSIGVVMLHADFSRQLDREGITPTLIHAGAHKVDGNPFEPLGDDVRADLQAEVNAFYDAFLATVAKGRGTRMTAAAARKTEARTFIGKAAVAAGLADRVGTFESALAELSRASGRITTPAGRTSMSDELSAARAEGMRAGAEAERSRFKAVMGSDHYKGREAAALSMLTTTDMAADVICNVLAGLPATAQATPIDSGAIYSGRQAQRFQAAGISTLSVPQVAQQAASATDVYAARRSATRQ
jgi:signal peptide peptidase SppA